MSEPTTTEILAQAIAHQEAQRWDEARPLLNQILSLQPEHADALYRAAVGAFGQGRREDALEFAQRCVAAGPNALDIQFNLAVLARMNGELEFSMNSLCRILEVKPENPDVLNEMGVLLATLGRLGEAVAAFQQALMQRSDFADALCNLASALNMLGQMDESIAAAKQASALRPRFYSAHYLLAVGLFVRRRLDEALSAAQTALHLSPEMAAAHNILGKVLKEMGRHRQAIDCFRKAIEIHPGLSEARDNLIMALQYDEGANPGERLAEITTEFEAWNRQFAPAEEAPASAYENDPDSDRRLRVGYVCADFREFGIPFSLDPLLRHHNRDQIEIYCYADVFVQEGVTQQFPRYAYRWRITNGASDETVFDQIRSDKVDVLVDLNLHSPGNRLKVFARKPAPIQISWLAYPGTSGVRGIDYHFSDERLEPDLSAAPMFSKPWRLPTCRAAYDPMSDDPPVNDLPASASGLITFGCLNHFSKINERALNLWFRILKSSAARLMMLGCCGWARQNVRDISINAGVDPSRIEFIERTSRTTYLRHFNRIDIALDTFLFNGNATTLDALWMGVPVLTMAGDSPLARITQSQLAHVDLKGFVARNEDEYLRLATVLSSNLPRLADIRANLREKMRRSPLMDGAGFARDVESAYRQMWKRWCESRR